VLVVVAQFLNYWLINKTRVSISFGKNEIIKRNLPVDTVDLDGNQCELKKK
jgi:hypothetical protein